MPGLLTSEVPERHISKMVGTAWIVEPSPLVLSGNVLQISVHFMINSGKIRSLEEAIF